MTKREMRTFNLPEPPADLQAVRDKEGDLWRRCPDDTWLGFTKSDRAAWSVDLGSVVTGNVQWVSVLEYGPLHEVTQEQEERAAALKALGPVKITDEVIDAVSDQQEVYGIARDRDRARWVATAALEAAGFEVTT